MTKTWQPDEAQVWELAQAYPVTEAQFKAALNNFRDYWSARSGVLRPEWASGFQESFLQYHKKYVAVEPVCQ